MKKIASLLIVFSICIAFTSYADKVHLNKIETYAGVEITTEEFDEFLSIQMDALAIPGLSIAVINDGHIVYHKALGVANVTTEEAITNGSIFEAASIAKPVMAFFVLKLSEKGIIDLDRPLYFYLPDEDMEVDQRYKNVTARMVLSHRTGFPNWRWFDQPPAGVEVNRGDFFMVSDPDTAFTYSGEAYSYLGRVIAHLNFVNMSEMRELFQQEVAIPLGMELAYAGWDDYLYDHKVRGHVEGKPTKRKWGTGLPNQNSLMFGGLQTEANSYAYFLTALMNEEGMYTETFKAMLSPHTPIPSDNVNYTKDGIHHWSLGFGIKPMNNDTLYRHGGSNKGFQSEVAFSKLKKYGYVFFVNCEKGNEFNLKLEEFLGMTSN